MNRSQGDSFAPQLLEGHFRDESREIRSRQVFAYVLEPARQIGPH
jgi:hypothetical protein